MEEYRALWLSAAIRSPIASRDMGSKQSLVKLLTKRQSGQFVTPGNLLGVIEEFTPGQGTYIENGRIYAKVSGRTLLDMQNKTVSVYPLARLVRIPQIGSIITGQVSSIQNKTAHVRIFKIGKDLISGVFSGLLYISDVSRSYVDSLHDAFKPGDIIRAKVISEKNRTFHLSTVDKHLGVLYAYCSQCGEFLQQKRYKLHCSACGRIEKRRFAGDYGEAAF